MEGVKMKCEDCDGEGEVDGVRCFKCDGTGELCDECGESIVACHCDEED